MGSSCAGPSLDIAGPALDIAGPSLDIAGPSLDIAPRTVQMTSRSVINGISRVQPRAPFARHLDVEPPHRGPFARDLHVEPSHRAPFARDLHVEPSHRAPFARDLHVEPPHRGPFAHHLDVDRSHHASQFRPPDAEPRPSRVFARRRAPVDRRRADFLRSGADEPSLWLTAINRAATSMTTGQPTGVPSLRVKT